MYVAYAIQRGFFTAKGARPDVYRAANLILRLAADGRILLSFKPPGFFSGAYHQARKIELEKQVASMYDQDQNDDNDDNNNDDGDDDGDGDDNLPSFRDIVDSQGKPKSKMGGAFNALLSLDE